jgi:hypothetical protein
MTTKDAPKLAYIAMTANGWAKAFSEATAIRLLRNDWGSNHVKKHGYIIYSVHPDSYCEEVNGAIVHPVGFPPVKIHDARASK